MSLTLQQLVDRTKTSFELDPENLSCSNLLSPLVQVTEKSRLKLDPIWKTQTDILEGPLYRQYIKQNPEYNTIYLREEVVKRLNEAVSHLPHHFILVLRAGHRPLTVQQAEFQQMVDKYVKEHPGALYEEAVGFARTYVSDPNVTLPPHCCGAAVDVDMFDTALNKLVDFGCPVNTNTNSAVLHSNKITNQQYASRMILLEAMLQAGFAPDYNEWWHYSYGDTVWAYFREQPNSLYGVIEPEL